MTDLTHQSAHPLGFRRQLFWNIRTLSIAVLLLVGGTLSWIAHDEYLQAQESEYRLLEAYARNANVRVEEAFGKIGPLLNLIAEARLNNRSFQGKAFAAVLERHRQDIPELGTLLVSDAAGRIISATDATIVGRDISTESYFTAQTDPEQTQKLFMSRPDKRLLGVTAVTVTLPIVGADQQFLGIAGVTIGFKFFPKVLQAVNPDDSASMSVIYNRDGDILYRRNDPEKFFGYNIVKVSTVFREHASSDRQMTRHIGPSAHDGKTRLFLVREVGDTGIGLILSRQLDAVLAVWWRNVVIYALIFLFTTVVVISLAVSASRQKKLEDAKLEALSRIQKIASQVPGLVYQYRLHPDGHYSLPFASVAIRDIFRLSPEEVRDDASRIFSLIHPNDYNAVVASIQQSAHELTPWHHEFRVKFDDGTVHWLLGNAMPQRDADGSVLWHGFITDITGRKQMEADIVESHERLREIEQRQTLSQERQRLMQDMHDGLGSSLISALRVAEHGKMDEAEVTQVLKGCIDDLKLTIDSMEPVEADLLLLLATLRFRLGPRLESTGIALRWEVQNVPPLDWLDPKNALHILRILQETFTNIIKHTHATEIRVATAVEGDYAVVSITDNGQGFAVESALKNGGKGLSNQMRRAQAIGAEIILESNDAGTRFTLRLPIKQATGIAA